MQIEKYFAQLKLSNRKNLFQFLIGTSITTVKRHFKSKSVFEASYNQFTKYKSPKTFFTQYGDAPITIVLENNLSITFSYFSYTRDVTACSDNNGIIHLGQAGLFFSNYALPLKEEDSNYLSDCLNVPIVKVSLLKKGGLDAGIVFHFENKESLVLGSFETPGVQLIESSTLNLRKYEQLEFNTSELKIDYLLPNGFIEYDIDKKGQVDVNEMNPSICTKENIDYLKELKSRLKQDGIYILDIQLFVNKQNEVKLLEPYDLSITDDVHITDRVLEAIVKKMEN